MNECSDSSMCFCSNLSDTGLDTVDAEMHLKGKTGGVS